MEPLPYSSELRIHLVSDVHPDPEEALSRTNEIKKGFTAEFLRSLHAKVNNGLAPEEVHDVMSCLTVFGKGNKRIEFMALMIEHLSEGREWVELLDLKNRASESKRSYGHELIRGVPNQTMEQGEPLLNLIRSNGYFEHSRKGKWQGILCSLLELGDLAGEGLKALRERAVLSEILAHESKNPGSHLNHWALDAFAGSAHQDLVIRMSIEHGIDLMRWQEEISQNSLKSKLASMQASVDAQRAIEGIGAPRRFTAHC